MTTLVAMVRGINVGGRNRLSMDDLRRLVAELGYRDVRTYVQSGNVVCRGPGGPDRLATSLAAALADGPGLDVPVVARTGEELAGVAARHPLAPRGRVPEADARLYHVTFLATAPDPAAVATLQAACERHRPDTFTVVGRDVYLHIPGGYGETKLNNTLFEKKLGGPATTRNWASVTELAALGAA